MKKFEIVKTTAEISWKERNEIKEGCTMYDVDPEKIASFGTKEEAEKELKKYKTDVCASGSLFTVEEFSIQENEYDEDGEWIGGGDIWKFTPMEIFVVDKETRKTIAKVKTYEEAEEAAEEYEGDAGADIVFSCKKIVVSKWHGFFYLQKNAHYTYNVLIYNHRKEINKSERW